MRVRIRFCVRVDEASLLCVGCRGRLRDVILALSESLEADIGSTCEAMSDPFWKGARDFAYLTKV